jgi:hypothetical protein
MDTKSLLSGAHLRTYEKIFQHPVSHNLEWREVRSLFARLGDVVEDARGKLSVAHNGQSLVLHVTQGKDVADMAELMKMRHFLERCDEPAAAADPGEVHLLLVIDHHEARIFRSQMHGAVPQRITPHGPDGDARHAEGSQGFARREEKPDPNSYFDPVAKAMKNADKILVFGSGTGNSSEMDQFLAWLKIHHADLAGHIVGSQVVDAHHTTEAQLLARARKFYETEQAA